MASTTTAPAGSTHSPQVVGNLFIQQYYQILHQRPELVYKFYQDNSYLGRPDAHGAMSFVTTMQAINDKILSMDYSESCAEIRTVDAQDSWNKGVLVLVTGYLTGKDNVRRDFTQSFFLAPQERNGYFVLNDIFRYVGEADHLQLGRAMVNGDDASPPPEPVPESLPQQEEPGAEPTATAENEEEENEEEVYNPSDNEDSVVEEEAPVEEVIDEAPIALSPAAEPSPAAVAQEEAPKKSYASIVKVMKENSAPLSGPAPAPARAAPAISERNATPAPSPAPVTDAPISILNATEGGSPQEEVDGHSIYIRGLPLNATSEQLEEEFKRFGSIKPNGVQVRSNKQQGFCFGFVEFEVVSAVHNAIGASPITIGGRQARVEEKRPSGSRVSNRGRFQPGRGSGFRNDGTRGRGSYGGGRGYGRSDFNNRTEFGSRGGGRGGSSGRGDGDVRYQRVDHTGLNRDLVETAVDLRKQLRNRKMWSPGFPLLLKPDLH